MANNKKKSKFKLNVDGKGTIFANSTFELLSKMLTGKYTKNANTHSSRTKRS